MYRTGNPAITGDLGKGGGGGHHHHHHGGGGFRWGGRGSIYESSFVFPYDVCFTNCVERGLPVSACRLRCSSGLYGAASDAAGSFGAAILPVAIIAGAAWLFFRKKRT